MARNDKHRTRMKLSNQARYAATCRLIEVHKEEYQRLYDEETAKRGVCNRRQQKLDRATLLREELARLEAETNARPPTPVDAVVERIREQLQGNKP